MLVSVTVEEYQKPKLQKYKDKFQYNRASPGIEISIIQLALRLLNQQIAKMQGDSEICPLKLYHH